MLVNSLVPIDIRKLFPSRAFNAHAERFPLEYSNRGWVQKRLR